jgi:hypothetical protein
MSFTSCEAPKIDYPVFLTIFFLNLDFFCQKPGHLFLETDFIFFFGSITSLKYLRGGACCFSFVFCQCLVDPCAVLTSNLSFFYCAKKKKIFFF